MQKTGFLDFFLMFGNVEVFFYLIDTLATENDLFDHERRYNIYIYIIIFYIYLYKSHEILQEIFEIIKEMSYKKEVENSLRNGGFRVIAYLLNMVIYIKHIYLSQFIYSIFRKEVVLMIFLNQYWHFLKIFLLLS